MSAPWTGGCACGAVRYTTAQAPVFQNHCQCRDCQRLAGTGHASWITFPVRSAMSITGETAQWQITGDSGRTKMHHFCATCGAPVFLTLAAMPDLMTVTAASLDDPSRFAPDVLTWRVGGWPWDPIDSALKVFDRSPRAH